MTKVKTQTWSSYYQKWNGWPTKWTYFDEDNSPVLVMKKLDDEGYYFLVSVILNGKTTDVEVKFNRFDEKNNWNVYKDVADNDEISITGTTLSSLCKYGWPKDGTEVQIYFWIYSENYAMLFM